jgi:hypothetical protein
MQNSFDNFLNKNLSNETQTINTVESQNKETIKDPEEDIGRFEDYFKYLNSLEDFENNIETNTTD